jgi:hypothetical protein
MHYPREYDVSKVALSLVPWVEAMSVGEDSSSQGTCTFLSRR